MRTLPDELISRLRQEFSADNLGATATLAHEASWNAPNPLGLFVVTTVLRHLEAHWDVPNFGDQAGMTEPALSDMEGRLRPPLLDYLWHVDEGPMDCEVERQLLNALVIALFKWTAEGPSPRPY